LTSREFFPDLNFPQDRDEITSRGGKSSPSAGMARFPRMGEGGTAFTMREVRTVPARELDLPAARIKG
jgi:hypothetical protein